MTLRPRILLFLLAAFAAPALAAPPPESRVNASLLADVSAIQPGQPFTLAFILTTQPHWHVYWQNPGDAGAATQFTFHLPKGFQADPTAYPLPIRFVQPGDILAYGYSGTAIFLTRITPPNDLPPGEKIRLSVEASWLCCKNVCVPGEDKLSLTLPAATSAQPSVENQKLFANARALVPAASPPDEVASIAPREEVDSATNTASLSALISWKTPPAGDVELFALPPESLALSQIKVDTRKNVTRISLRARLLAGQKLRSAALKVLVTYTDSLDRRRGFYTDLDLHALAAATR